MTRVKHARKTITPRGLNQSQGRVQSKPLKKAHVFCEHRIGLREFRLLKVRNVWKGTRGDSVYLTISGSSFREISISLWYLSSLCTMHIQAVPTWIWKYLRELTNFVSSFLHVTSQRYAEGPWFTRGNQGQKNNLVKMVPCLQVWWRKNKTNRGPDLEDIGRRIRQKLYET